MRKLLALVGTLGLLAAGCHQDVPTAEERNRRIEQVAYAECAPHNGIQGVSIGGRSGETVSVTCKDGHVRLFWTPGLFPAR